MKKFLKDNIIPLIVGISIYIYSILTTKYYFQFSYSEFDSFAWFRYIVIRMIFLILDFSIVFYLKNIIKKIKLKDKETRNLIKFFGLALVINAIFLLLIWPGNWINDELGVLYNAKGFMYYSWQNYLTVIFFSICLMCIPTAISIVIIQVIFISFAFAYFINYIYKRINTKLVYFLYLILLLPPVIYNNLYPLRITMYTYIELIFLTWMFKKYKDKEELDIKTTLISSMAIFVLSFWRSEGIYYLALPIIMFFLFKKYSKHIFLKIIVIEFLALVLFGTFSYIDKMYDEEAYVKYKMTAIINPLSIMLQGELKGDVEADIEKIDEAIDVNLLKQNPSYWNIIIALDESLGLYRENIVENYDGVMKSYLKIVINNFPEFIKERVEVYKITNGKYDDLYRYYSLNDKSDFKTLRTEIVTNDLLGKPISNNLRDKFIAFLRGEKINNVKLFWNVTPIAIGCIILVVVFIYKRRFIESLIIINLLVKSVLVFLTTPATFFMYYYPLFLEGLVIIIAYMIYVFKYRIKFKKLLLKE